MTAGFVFKPNSKDPFYHELKGEVNSYFDSNNLTKKATPALLVRIFLLIITTLALYLTIVFVSLPMVLVLCCVILLGLAITAIGFNISHEALHGSLFQKHHLNRLFGFTMDLVGLNSYLWKINHRNHHAFTNVRGLDGDIKDSKFLRLSPYAPYRGFHRYQTVTAVLVYSIYILLVIYWFNTINILGKNFGNKKKRHHPARALASFSLFKITYLLIWVVAPLSFMDISAGAFILGYLLLNIVISIAFTTVFFVAHNNEVAEFNDETLKNEPISWAEHQLCTTANFKINKLAGQFLGGLQYQIEHHLFPSICSVHYPQISLIVQRVAGRYGLPYNENPSFGAAIQSHFKFLKKLSVPN